MASLAVAPDISSIELSQRDAWALYRLAYFPKVGGDRAQLLDEPGITATGRRIGMYLLHQDTLNLSQAERVVGDRYLAAAKRERLDLPAAAE